MVDSRWAEDLATGLLMRPNRSKLLSRSGCVLRRARVCHLTLLTYIYARTSNSVAVISEFLSVLRISQQGLEYLKSHVHKLDILKLHSNLLNVTLGLLASHCGCCLGTRSRWDFRFPHSLPLPFSSNDCVKRDRFVQSPQERLDRGLSIISSIG